MATRHMSCCAVLVIVLAGAATARTFRCDQVWATASANNTFTDCFTKTDHLVTIITASDQLPLVILAAIPLLLFLIGLFCCPLVTCARYCCKCCGSYRRRPTTCCCGGAEWDEATEAEKQAQYPASSIRNTKCMAIVNLIITMGCVGLGAAGFLQFDTTYASLWGQLKSVLTWVNLQSSRIQPLVTINSTGTLIPPLDNSLFQKMANITKDFGSQIDSLRNSADTYVTPAYSSAIFLAFLPLLFMLLTAGFACFNIRKCLPCVNLVCHWIFFIVVSLGATVFLVIAFVMGNVCGEKDLFVNSPTAPGLISLAGVPLCNANVPFDQIQSKISSVITTQAASACDAMLNICDANAVYNPLTPQLVFQCAITNGTTDCPDFTTAYTKGNALTLKTGATIITQCQNGATVISPCTLAACAQYCTDSTIRQYANNSVTALGYANNGQIAYNLYVQPLLSCVNVYTQALAPFHDCVPFTNSMYFLGGALLGFTFVFLSGMCVLWRGQKRFFDPVPVAEERAPFA